MQKPSRRCAELVYVVVALAAMMALTSLAVDLARYQSAHNEMYGTVVAAARAGAYKMLTSGFPLRPPSCGHHCRHRTTNSTDVALISSSNVTVTFGYWNTGTSTFTAGGLVSTLANSQVPSTVNACQVSISYSVPLCRIRPGDRDEDQDRDGSRRSRRSPSRPTRLSSMQPATSGLPTSRRARSPARPTRTIRPCTALKTTSIPTTLPAHRWRKPA